MPDKPASSAPSLRIAMLAACPLPAPRGTPVRIQRIAEHLGQRGHDVHVFTYGLENPQPIANVTVHRTPRVWGYRGDTPGPNGTKLLLLDPLLARLFAQCARRMHFDVIHAHHAEGLLVCLPGRRHARAPVIYDVHTLLGAELPFYSSLLPRWLRARAGTLLDHALPRTADRVIAVSEEIRNTLDNGARRHRPPAAVIPNGVESEFLAKGERAQRAHDGEAPTLVYAGNLAAFQGIDPLLRMFACARAELPALRLRLLTHSDFSPYLRLARELRVHEAIDVEACTLADLPARLARASVAVNPRSSCSGIPQKLINYMAAGCAIVSFAGSAKHIQDAKEGLVVADGNTHALAQAALQLIRDRGLARTLGERAWDKANRLFGWDATAQRVEHVYADAIGGR
ncbi:MAG: glycosyltransferase family 4 protein [Steroidobacteraceae bacterium]